MDSLTVQSMMAVDFIASSWPKVKIQAMEVLEGWTSEIDELILCGCGDSHHAALSLEMALSRWTGKRVRAVPAMTAARYLVPGLGSSSTRSLVIGISASGEVARTCEAVELGVAVGARTLAITGDKANSLAQTAESSLTLTPPPVPFGPGLLSYLASMIMGLAVAAALAPASHRQELESYIEDIPTVLDDWREEQIEMGKQFAEDTIDSVVVYLGSGSAYGSALFAAAKLIEASGAQAWGQDVEEWAHLEYFCEPADMPTWLLSSGGRSTSREQEVLKAARTIGRRIVISSWHGGDDWSPYGREALAPLGLWAGPVAYASHRAEIIGEQPFRSFGGGRNCQEGGGISRIRSSARVSPVEILPLWQG
ncbi:MAG: SIS domain-containing protein [Anaerolineales bacterium]|nr:SIS domain-containing protein [Anaerolineales bacterium]